MKVLLTAAALLACSSLAIAPAARAQTNNPEKSTAQTEEVLRGKESTSVFRTLNGDVSADGTRFVSDRHEEVWAVNNPDALRAYAGQHITFLGTANPQDGRVTAEWINGAFVGQIDNGDQQF